MLLALAVLALDRPGWADYLRGVARELFDGAEAFDTFRQLNADRWEARLVRSV